jgi:catechol-2,3-dioxygenase
MTQSKKAHALGFNHIALEVGDVEEALTFYARIVDFKLRSKEKDMAFIAERASRHGHVAPVKKREGNQGTCR